MHPLHDMPQITHQQKDHRVSFPIQFKNLRSDSGQIKYEDRSNRLHKKDSTLNKQCQDMFVADFSSFWGIHQHINRILRRHYGYLFALKRSGACGEVFKHWKSDWTTYPLGSLNFKSSRIFWTTNPQESFWAVFPNFTLELRKIFLMP